MNGDMGDLMKYAFFPSRQPPQVEKVEYNITTQVVILLLQGLSVMLLVLIGMALFFAVVVSELQFSPGLDVTIVRVIVGAGTGAGAVLVGIMLTWKKNLQVGVFFMVLLFVLGGVVYLLVPQWADTAAWPWALLFGSIAFNYGAYHTRRAFVEEIDDPAVRGMPATERTKQMAIEWMMEQAMAAAAPRAGAVDVWIEAADGQIKIASLPGTLADVVKFCKAGLENKLALDTILPRSHPIWDEAYDRGLIAPRDPNKPTLGQQATVAGRHVFERVLEELQE